MSELLDAKNRGVILDIGHGLRSFSAPVAEAMLEQGVQPDVISTDIHARSIDGPVYDLPTTMSKMLNLGMDLVDIVAATTANPAGAIGRASELGNLMLGSRADIAVFQCSSAPAGSMPPLISPQAI